MTKCIHNKRRTQCKECNGGSICEHSKRKYQCKECHGSQMCNHNRRKHDCKECGGSQICNHDKQKKFCKECCGSQICEHDKQKYQCVICTPNSKYFCTSCRLFIVTKKNNYLCSYCNPNTSKNKKTKENRLKEFLIKNNITFIQDKMIKNDCCLKYRPDFLIDCNSYFIILECDENGHEQYDKECEVIRMNNIASGLGLPTKFIRYNPDKKGIRINKKEELLLETVNKYLNKDFLEDLEIVYLFY